jgi:AcrR family transcriptional regulator
VPAQPPITERSRRTRANLARALHEEIGRTGVLDVSAVTNLAGVSPATFYAHFDDHEAALAAALDISLEAVTDVTRRLFTVEKLLDDGLESTIDDIVREAVAAFRTEALVMRAALARLPHSRAIREVYRRREDASRQHLSRQVSLAQKANVVRAGSPVDHITVLLVLTEGLNNPLLLRGTTSPEVLNGLRRAIVAALAP